MSTKKGYRVPWPIPISYHILISPLDESSTDRPTGVGAVRPSCQLRSLRTCEIWGRLSWWLENGWKMGNWFWKMRKLDAMSLHLWVFRCHLERFGFSLRISSASAVEGTIGYIICISTSGGTITGLWFGTWMLFFHSVGKLIIPTDNFRFSEG